MNNSNAIPVTTYKSNIFDKLIFDNVLPYQSNMQFPSFIRSVYFICHTIMLLSEETQILKTNAKLYMPWDYIH